MEKTREAAKPGNFWYRDAEQLLLQANAKRAYNGIAVNP
jgi:hypothetical protein